MLLPLVIDLEQEWAVTVVQRDGTLNTTQENLQGEERN